MSNDFVSGMPDDRPTPETFAQRVAREAGERIVAIDEELREYRATIEMHRATVRSLVAEREDLVRVAGATVKRTVNRKRNVVPDPMPGAIKPKGKTKAKAKVTTGDVTAAIEEMNADA